MSRLITIQDLLAWADGKLTTNKQAAIRSDIDASESRIKQLIEKFHIIKDLVNPMLEEMASRPRLDASQSRIRQLIEKAPMLKDLPVPRKTELAIWLDANLEYFEKPMDDSQRAGLLAVERVLATRAKTMRIAGSDNEERGRR